MHFTFLHCIVSLILCVFLSVLPKLPYEQRYIYLDNMFVLSTQFIIYVQIDSKLTCCCHFKPFHLEIKKKKDFELTFPVFVYGDCILWHQCHTRQRRFFFLLVTVITSLCNCKWLFMQVASDHKYQLSLKSVCWCQLLNLLRTAWTNSFVLFHGCD